MYELTPPLQHLIRNMYHSVLDGPTFGEWDLDVNFPGYLRSYLDEVYPMWRQEITNRLNSRSTVHITVDPAHPDTIPKWRAVCSECGNLPLLPTPDGFVFPRLRTFSEEYNLSRSEHDLCVITGWDHERRFHDGATAFPGDMIINTFPYHTWVDELSQQPVRQHQF